MLEETVLALARRARRITGSTQLCVAGGVALNAVANSKVIEASGFEDVFVPPDPGDGGAALGAALHEYYRLSASRRCLDISPFLGKSYPDNSISWARGMRFDTPGRRRSPLLLTSVERDIAIEEFDCDETLTQSVAKELACGRIVGWFQDRFEFGPRALGNRSLLVDPAGREAVQRLSILVKERASFRPYALSIREEDSYLVFDFQGCLPRCAFWMQMVKRVKDDIEPAVRYAIHCDHTTRLQVCTARQNPRFHLLLTAFGRLRGLGALLNTSFNEPGYPIVASPEDALLMFARTEMDILVVQRSVLRKVARQ